MRKGAHFARVHLGHSQYTDQACGNLHHESSDDVASRRRNRGYRMEQIILTSM